MPRKILQIIPEIATGGAERIVFETAKAITQSGDECFVFTNGGRMESAFKEIGAKLIIGDAKTKNPFKILKTNVDFLVKFIKEQEIDLIHVHSRAPAISAYLAAKKTKTPLISTYHGIYPAKNAIKRYYNSFMAKADLVIANSNFTKEHLIEQHKTNRDKVRLVYCGIDTGIFNPKNIKKSDVENILNSWGIKDKNSKNILLPARLTSWKGQKILIEAARILANKNIKPQYILAGDSQGRIEYENELKQLISDAKLEENIHLVGHCSNIPLAMAACDIIITPSTKEEAFGLTAVEAQAMGKITIASRLGASVETIDDGKSGFLFAPKDAHDLALKIEEALNLDENKQKEMCNFGIWRANNIFGAKVLHQETLKIYDEVLKKS